MQRENQEAVTVEAVNYSNGSTYFVTGSIEAWIKAIYAG